MSGRGVRRLSAVAAAIVVMLAWPAAALACDGWTEPGMEQQLMCPVCHERLDQSYSPVADQIRSNLFRWCAQGYTADRVRSVLVAQFGEEVLAAPPARGFDLLAWVVPAAVLAGGAAVAAAVVAAWSRSRGRAAGGAPEVAADPSLEARIDSDLAGFDP